ncbi:MAG: serine hydrolase domain-containing protein [Maricaulaceae bacterium]|jgi:CubicO group peptidase (beta-lactamase class C family)
MLLKSKLRAAAAGAEPGSAPFRKFAALCAAGAAVLALGLGACSTMGGMGGGSAQPDVSSIEPGDPVALGFDPDAIAEARASLQQSIDDGKISGGILVAGRNGQAAIVEMLGTQGPDDDRPMDEHTLFRVYSMSKLIVSVALMDMVEDGLVDIDDPVSDYLPEHANLTVITEDGGTRPAETVMTIRHLLTHTSGLIYNFIQPDTALGEIYLEAGTTRRDIPTREFAALLASLPLANDPGAGFNYSHSTDVLGALMEVVEGKDLQSILDARVLDPLGMDETSFFVAPENADLVAQPIYGDMHDPLIVEPFQSGGGGLMSSTEDYLRFTLMLAGSGEYRGARVLEPETLEAMYEDQLVEGVSRDNFFYRQAGGWGLGFALQPISFGDPNSPTTKGWQGVGGTVTWVDPASDIFALYMIQARGAPGGTGFNVRGAVYDAYVGDEE